MSTMAVHSNSGSDSGRRPKGILKRKSEQQIAGQAAIAAAAVVASSSSSATSNPLPLTTGNIKELTLQNTSKNAGKHRSSSVSRSATSRKQSLPTNNGSSVVPGSPHTPDAPGHLTWDEANLILHEQNKVPRMKIDEPKTPFAPHYNPDEDEDMMMEGDIPSLDIGEGHGWGGLMDPQTPRVDSVDGLEAPKERRMSSSSHGSEKHVGVHPKDASPTHDAEREPQSEDEKRKHDMFERKRKQHYEMSGIKNLLGKSIDIDEDEDDDEDDDGNNINGNDNNDDDDDGDGDINMESTREQKKVHPSIPPIPGQFKK